MTSSNKPTSKTANTSTVKTSFNHKSSIRAEQRENPKKYEKAKNKPKTNNNSNPNISSKFVPKYQQTSKADRTDVFKPKYDLKSSSRPSVSDMMDGDFKPRTNANPRTVLRPAFKRVNPKNNSNSNSNTITKSQYEFTAPDPIENKRTTKKEKLFFTDKNGVGEASSAVPNTTSWGGVASWYDKMISDKDSYQNQIILPKVLNVLDIKKDEVILDLGCGVGYFCEQYNQKGAKTIGVDIGTESIAIAKTKTNENIEYHSHTAESIPFIKNNSIDKITIILSIQNIKKAEQTIAECARVLRKNGKLVLVINHPCYRIPQNSSWVWSEDEYCQYRRVDKYMSNFEVSIDMNPSKAKGSKNLTMSFHRNLEWYIQNLSKNNLLVSDLQEWISHRSTDQGPKKTPLLEASRKEIPLFMCIVAKLS